MATEVNVFLAFGAGLLSFLSPCVLPLYPAFLSYITGMSISEMKEESVLLQRRSLLHTLFFLLGFSIAFVVLGFSTSFISQFFRENIELIRQIGAICVIFFGLMVAGIIKPEWLMRERKFEFKNRPSGYFGTALIGLAFAAGWTPCMGPILAAVITMATFDPGAGMLYMMSYVLGFALPFLILSFFIGRLNWFRKYSQLIMKVGGYLMIFIGVMLFFDWMSLFIRWLSPLFDGFTGF